MKITAFSWGRPCDLLHFKCWGSPDSWMDMVELLHITPQPAEFLTHVFLCQVHRTSTRARRHQNEELSQYVIMLSARQHTHRQTQSNCLELSYNSTLCMILGSVSGSGMFEFQGSNQTVLPTMLPHVEDVEVVLLSG